MNCSYDILGIEMPIFILLKCSLLVLVPDVFIICVTFDELCQCKYAPLQPSRARNWKKNLLKVKKR